MEEVKEEKASRKSYRISEKHSLTSDGKLNIILQERVAKRIGKGVNAPLSGEYGWKDSLYYGSVEAFADTQLNRDIHSSFKELPLDEQEKYVVFPPDEVKEYIEQQKKEYREMFKEMIVLELAKVKGAKEDDE